METHEFDVAYPQTLIHPMSVRAGHSAALEPLQLSIYRAPNIAMR